VSTVVALDVGGTAMKGALLTAEGTSYRRWPTPRADGPDAVVAAALKAIDDLVAEAGDAVAVGLVVPGLVDDDAGVAIDSENIRWRDVPFRDLVRERTGLPVGFGHDVRAGGLAERAEGAAGGCDDVLFMPIGTGIAGAMFVDGRLVRDRYAGEIGHIDVGVDIECACGARGCLEAVASGAAIARRYRLAGGEQLPGSREVLRRRDAGDAIAVRVWSEAIAALARALTTYISLLAPERIVIGGGLAGAGPALFGPLRESLHQLLVWQREPTLVPAALGDNAACLGAAILARRALHEQQKDQPW
jgi:glucokinase